VPSSFYDVIVLGNDLAGLIAATLCARRGLRVLVIDAGAAPPERYDVPPYSLPRTAQTFVGESSPAVRRVVAELNFIQLVRRKLSVYRPSFQVVLPDARIEVSADADALGHELQRELPDEKAALEAAFARAADVSRVLEPVLGQDVSFPPDGFWEKREIARSDSRLPSPDDDLLPGVPEGHRARALLALPAAFSLPLDPRARSPVAALRAFDLWRRGAARMEGGVEALRAMLVEKLRTQHAGEVRTARWKAISSKWGRAQGVVLGEREELVGAQQVICALPAGEIAALLGDKPPRRVAQAERGLKPTAHRMTLNVVLAGTGVPEGISPVTFVVVDPAAPLLGDNAFALHLGEPDDDNRVVLTLVANVAAEPDGLAAAMSELRPRLLERLEEILPFSREHILLAHAPQLDDPTAAPAEPLYTSTLPSALGVGALPYDLGLRGLVSASAQNLLGLGVEGAFAAGWSAARIVSHAAGKKKDYLKDEVLLGG